MSIFEIETAEREGARLVIGLGGISGTGKTYTALQLAYGLANYNSRKVGFICTENRRGRLYSDALKNEKGEVQKFLIGDLTAPFSPQRYIDGIEAFVKAGVEVLVIDSISHEWEGIGGCEDIAQSGNPKAPAWNKAKAEHKKMMNALLSSPLHIIVCMRAREKVQIVKRDGKTEYEPLGVMPICEKNFTFELTASLMMWSEGKQQQALKVPAELKPMLGRESGYITAADGKAIRDWVDGAKKVDDAVKAARDSLVMVCEKGMQALQDAWAALPKNIRKAIGPDGCPEDLKRSAADFDKLAAEKKPGGTDLADLNNEILGTNDNDRADN